MVKGNYEIKSQNYEILESHISEIKVEIMR